MKTATNLINSALARTALMLAQTAISFFMLPFLLSRLGDKWYGIWTILGGLVGYYYLMDFGLATAVSRYVTRYIAKGETQKTNSVITTSLIIYSLMAIVILAITVLLCLGVSFFVPDKESLTVVRLVLLILGLQMGLEFPFKAFAGIIGAFVRYELLSLSGFFSLILGAGLTVFFMLQGYGIIALALIGFFCSQLSNVIFYLIAKHLFPDMEIGRKHFAKERVRGLFGYSVWSFIIQMGDQLRLRIDSFVIGFFLSATQVTHYFIGARLVELFMNLTYRATNITTPVFTKYHAVGDYDQIRDKLLFLTKVNTIIAAFGGGLIIIHGKDFIQRWVGQDYGDSYTILVILTIGIIFEIINNPTNNVLYAISKHRYLALINISEGVINLILSIVLIRYYGIKGVAIGTVIPLIFSRIVLIPLYVCKCIDLSFFIYFSASSKILLYSSIYFYLSYHYFIQSFLLPQYPMILISIILLTPVYFSSIMFLFFKKDERIFLLSLLPASNCS